MIQISRQNDQNIDIVQTKKGELQSDQFLSKFVKMNHQKQKILTKIAMQYMTPINKKNFQNKSQSLGLQETEYDSQKIIKTSNDESAEKKSYSHSNSIQNTVVFNYQDQKNTTSTNFTSLIKTNKDTDQQYRRRSIENQTVQTFHVSNKLGSQERMQQAKELREQQSFQKKNSAMTNFQKHRNLNQSNSSWNSQNQNMKTSGISMSNYLPKLDVDKSQSPNDVRHYDSKQKLNSSYNSDSYIQQNGDNIFKTPLSVCTNEQRNMRLGQEKRQDVTQQKFKIYQIKNNSQSVEKINKAPYIQTNSLEQSIQIGLELAKKLKPLMVDQKKLIEEQKLIQQKQPQINQVPKREKSEESYLEKIAKQQLNQNDKPQLISKKFKIIKSQEIDKFDQNLKQQALNFQNTSQKKQQQNTLQKKNSIQKGDLIDEIKLDKQNDKRLIENKDIKKAQSQNQQIILQNKNEIQNMNSVDDVKSDIQVKKRLIENKDIKKAQSQNQQIILQNKNEIQNMNTVDDLKSDIQIKKHTQNNFRKIKSVNNQQEIEQKKFQNQIIVKQNKSNEPNNKKVEKKQRKSFDIQQEFEKVLLEKQEEQIHNEEPVSKIIQLIEQIELFSQQDNQIQNQSEQNSSTDSTENIQNNNNQKNHQQQEMINSEQQSSNQDSNELQLDYKINNVQNKFNLQNVQKVLSIDLRNQAQMKVIDLNQDGFKEQISDRKKLQKIEDQILASCQTEPNLLKPDLIKQFQPFLSEPFITQYGVQESKQSVKQISHIQGFAVNTHHGTKKETNEDRISVMLNLLKPANRLDIPDSKWPRIYYFAIFDGHAGDFCANYLKKYLHQYIINNPSFPNSMIYAITDAFEQCDEQFLQKAEKIDNNSGSCAAIVLIVDDVVYNIWTGDSRIILSREGGKNIYQVSKDHKPSDKKEYIRIVNNEGEVYQSGKIMRMKPGGLAVSRAFGDLQSKQQCGALICTPEIKQFNINDKIDFICIGSDGIYDKLSNSQIAKIVINQAIQLNQQINVNHAVEIHNVLGKSAQHVIENSIEANSSDNQSVIIIAFNGFKQIGLG